MRINEVIVEAISLTQYESTVEEAIKDGVYQAMSEIPSAKGFFPQEEKLAKQAQLTPLLQKLKDILSVRLSEKIANSIRIKISRELGKDLALSIKFDKTAPTINAYVDKTEMVISDRYTNKLAKEILESIRTTVLDNYAEDQLVDGLFFTIKLIGSRDQQTSSYVFGDSEQTINSIVDDVLHELVHVVQHNRQFQKGRSDIEYRSYLDKKKHEFRNTDFTRSDDKFYHLYYASPQEIPALVHQMAMEAVRIFDLRNIKSEEDIPIITSEDVISFMDTWIGKKYNDPKNPKEYAVFKKYAKLVYQEIQRYIDEKRRSFKPKESE